MKWWDHRWDRRFRQFLHYTGLFSLLIRLALGTLAAIGRHGNLIWRLLLHPRLRLHRGVDRLTLPAPPRERSGVKPRTTSSSDRSIRRPRAPTPMHSVR
jgi:hypothetical protein